MIDKVKKFVELLGVFIVFDATKKIEIKDARIPIVKRSDAYHESDNGENVSPFRSWIH